METTVGIISNAAIYVSMSYTVSHPRVLLPDLHSTDFTLAFSSLKGKKNFWPGFLSISQSDLNPSMYTCSINLPVCDLEYRIFFVPNRCLVCDDDWKQFLFTQRRTWFSFKPRFIYKTLTKQTWFWVGINYIYMVYTIFLGTFSAELSKEMLQAWQMSSNWKFSFL